MSDSFIAIFGTGLFTGVALTLIILLLTGGKNDRHTYVDTDMRIYVPHRDRDRGRNQRNSKQLDAEKEILRHAEKLGVKIGE